MSEIDVSVARDGLSSLLDRAERGEHKHTVRQDSDGPLAAQAALRIRKRAYELKAGFIWLEIKRDRDTGRP